MDRIIKAFQLPGKRKAHSQMIWVCIGSSSKVTDGLFQMATPTFNQAGQIEDVGMPRLQFYSCFNTFCRKIKISLSHGKIGRAHVLTPVTWPSRMPSAAFK